MYTGRIHWIALCFVFAVITIDYMDKSNLTVPVIVRMTEKERAVLAKEAEAEARTLSNYVRHLLQTHPKRQKKQKPQK